MSKTFKSVSAMSSLSPDSTVVVQQMMIPLWLLKQYLFLHRCLGQKAYQQQLMQTHYHVIGKVALTCQKNKYIKKFVAIPQKSSILGK